MASSQPPHSVSRTAAVLAAAAILARPLSLFLLAVLLLGITLSSSLASWLQPGTVEPLLEPARTNVGFTFSRRQAEYLKVPWRETFQAAAELRPGLVRLGSYWDEIERQPGVYDFANLDWLLDQAESRRLQVMLTVGMKAPRWPEYYLPPRLQRELGLPYGARVSDNPRLREATLSFIQQVVERYRDRDVIAYWQVENEPLDASGRGNWQIGADFLAEEVALVRALDARDRPIVLNMFVDTSPLSRLGHWRAEMEARALTILRLGDVLGLDIYPSTGLKVLGHDVYLDWTRFGWEQSVLDLQRLAQVAGREAWVIEAQAEPWEPARVVYTQPPQSRSVRPGLAANTFERIQAAGFPTILFWGVEHWYMRREVHQDPTWWDLLGLFFPLTGTTSQEVPVPPPNLGAY